MESIRELNPIFKDSIAKFGDYFLNRLWKNRKEINGPLKAEKRKVAERTICVDVLRELADHINEVKDDFHLLGIPKEIADSIRSDLKKVAPGYFEERSSRRKKKKIDTTSLPDGESESEVKYKHEDGEDGKDGEDSKDGKDGENEDEKVIERKKKLKKESQSYLIRILSSIVDFYPTCVVLRNSLKRRTSKYESKSDSKIDKKITPSNIEIYKTYYEYFKNVITDYRDKFVPIMTHN